WSEEACAAFGIDPGSLAPVRPADAVLGPVAPWLREAAGLDAGTLVVLGCGDEMAATLGAGVAGAGARPGRRHRAAPARRPGRLAAGEPRLALGRRVPLVPRRARLGRGGAVGRHRHGRVRAPERP